MALWTGSAFITGNVLLYPWNPFVEDPTTPPPTGEPVDGGSPPMTVWAFGLDGGTPSTDFGALDTYDGGTA